MVSIVVECISISFWPLRIEARIVVVVECCFWHSWLRLKCILVIRVWHFGVEITTWLLGLRFKPAIRSLGIASVSRNRVRSMSCESRSSLT